MTASLAFAWRAVLKMKHVPEQLLDVTVLPVMLLLMSAYRFGGAVAGSVGAYLHDVLPGILVVQVACASLCSGQSSRSALPSWPCSPP
jgi:ABC-2 type transport system permease protein